MGCFRLKKCCNSHFSLETDINNAPTALYRPTEALTAAVTIVIATVYNNDNNDDGDYYYYYLYSGRNK